MSESSSVNSQNTCGLCNENKSKYCCPRCEVFYCSLDCYKSEKHIDCSEGFYRDCVNEELSHSHVDDESRRKMLEILKKMQNDDVEDQENIEEILGNVEELENEGSIDSDDDDEVDLHERVKGLNLDDPDALWNALTVDERNEFEALLNQGEVGTLIPQWNPWWMYRKKDKLVQNIDDKIVNEEAEALQKCPVLIEVPEFAALTKVKPSPAIVFNIANVLASYAFTTRYFNGEIDPVEATVYILNICSNLDSNTNYEDLATAVEAVAQKCLQSELIETDTESLDVMKHDTLLIIQGPSKENQSYFCKAALSHLYRIFSDSRTAKKALSKISKDKGEFSRKFPEHTREHLPNLDVSKVKKCLKKLEFYLSFIEFYSNGIEVE